MSRVRNPWVRPWVRLGLEAWSLGLESSTVIGLRAMTIAAGGAGARAESRLMVEEKINAAVELQAKALSGGLGLTPAQTAAGAIAHYRRKVRANRRRLTRT